MLSAHTAAQIIVSRQINVWVMGTNLSDFSLLPKHDLVVEVLLFFLHHHDGQTFLLCFFLLLQACWVFYLQLARCHFDLQRLKGTKRWVDKIIRWKQTKRHQWQREVFRIFLLFPGTSVLPSSWDSSLLILPPHRLPLHCHHPPPLPPHLPLPPPLHPPVRGLQWK